MPVLRHPDRDAVALEEPCEVPLELRQRAERDVRPPDFLRGLQVRPERVRMMCPGVEPEPWVGSRQRLEEPPRRVHGPYA